MVKISDLPPVIIRHYAGKENTITHVRAGASHTDEVSFFVGRTTGTVDVWRYDMTTHSWQKEERDAHRS